MSNFNPNIKEEIQDPLGYIPSEFSSLFPIRYAPNVQLDLNTYRLLLEKLKCKFCSQLMQNPVYLKCSHRFCRPCIQRYIRSSSKKACPSCRFPLLSKRELRSDDFTIDFIDLVFGQIKLPTVAKTGESAELKLEDSDEIKVRKRARNRNEYNQLESIIVRPRKKHTKMMNFEQNIVDLRDSTLINSSLQDVNYHIKGRLSSQNQHQAKIEEGGIDYSYATEQQSESFQKYLVKQANKSQSTSDLGLEYFNDLRLKNGTQIFIKIKLENNPFKPLTPSLNWSQIECSAFSKLESIIFLIYQEFNLFSEYVVLHVMKQGGLEIIDPDLTLAAINEQYWINCSQYSPFDLAKNIEKLALNDQNEPQSSRIIYFSVQFDQQNLKQQ